MPEASSLRRIEAFHILQSLAERRSHEPRGLVVIVVSAARRFGDDGIHHPELETVGGVGLEGGSRLLRLACIAPENGGAALRRDD